MNKVHLHPTDVPAESQLCTDDDGTDAPEHIHEIAQLGTIKVTIDRRKRLGKGSAGKQSGSKPEISTKISEKIIKGRAKDAITTFDFPH